MSESGAKSTCFADKHAESPCAGVGCLCGNPSEASLSNAYSLFASMETALLDLDTLDIWSPICLGIRSMMGKMGDMVKSSEQLAMWASWWNLKVDYAVQLGVTLACEVEFAVFNTFWSREDP